ncbi:nicotinate-nucleotide--dimethylbenzimidazole phosphoribosyltransferase [Paraglaciecola sp.]|uniref:nicotinate-nucleotide--dimethylbenzimidazole phosphoribosyltransferase n=1 Tax=Paraglaciecola sp. TaxID=1920173 RepID=UPI0030F41776
MNSQSNTSSSSVFDAHYWAIPALDEALLANIDTTIANKTKPLGALGQLENLARQLAHIQGIDKQQGNKILLKQPTMLIFAADHGIAQNGISIAPPDVTGQMVLNFLAGGAAINCFCRTFDWHLQVIDAGMLQPAPIQHAMLLNKRLGEGTDDFSQAPAMSAQQAQQALVYGAQVAQQAIKQGSNLLAFGEMGIGNTSSASALLSLLGDFAPELTTGKGTGINEQQFVKKMQLIDQAINRVKTHHGDSAQHPAIALMEVGGFEIGQIVGAMLATAAAGKTLLVDGFIVTVAALIATKIAPRSRGYMLFAHTSAEQAHELVLSQLEAQPLLSLGMRLGEGTGAALALPLLQAAASFYNDMATFASAQVKV